jgi:hypothetical protein
MLNIVMLNVIMASLCLFAMLNAVMLNVGMVSVVMLRVLAPNECMNVCFLFFNNQVYSNNLDGFSQRTRTKNHFTAVINFCIVIS